MPELERYEPSPAEIREAEASMTDEQRADSMEREDTLYEGRLQEKKDAEERKSEESEELPKNSFVVGGRNESSDILKTTAISGKSLEKLDRHMQNDMYGLYEDRFEWGKTLRERMARDNDIVLDLGLTHQEVAAPLIYARDRLIKEDKSEWKDESESEFSLNGKHYKVSQRRYASYERPIFQDESMTKIAESPFGTEVGDSLLKVEDLDSGKQISFWGIIPEEIDRFGVYEGYKQNHINPQDIIDLFSLKKLEETETS